MPTPRVIHFIWAGGEKPFPKPNQDIILEWKKKNPDFRIILWVDKKSTPTSVFTGYHRLGYKNIATEGGLESVLQRQTSTSVTPTDLSSPILLQT